MLNIRKHSLILKNKCGALINTSQQPSSIQLLAQSSPGGIRERIGRVKGKLLGWDKESLMGKAKVTYTNRRKQRINSLLPMDRPSPKVQGHITHSTVSLEDKCHHSICPPFSSFFTPLYIQFIYIHMPYGLEYPFGQFASPVLDVSSPIFPCTSLHTSRAMQKAEKALALCDPCSATTKHLCIINLVFSTNLLVRLDGSMK